MTSSNKRLWAALCAVWVLISADTARAFTHVVKKGETLASIAERIYGRIHYERILVHANALDAAGGTAIAPGMVLEIPAVRHRRVEAGETWPQLAKELLGDERRADVLSRANDAKSWIAPDDGADVIVPYNLRFVVQQRETVPSIAARFFADKESAWMLDRYNGVGGHALHRGDMILVPLTDLPLTEEGKREGSVAEATARSQGGGAAHEAQRRVAAELPLLMTEVRGGHYLEAVVRANRLMGLGELTVPQVAQIHQVLTEAYVALDAPGLAAASCQKWRESDPAAQMSPMDTSPKIIDVCKAVEQPK